MRNIKTLFDSRIDIEPYQYCCVCVCGLCIVTAGIRASILLLHRSNAGGILSVNKNYLPLLQSVASPMFL